MVHSKEALEVIRHCCEECLYLPQNQSIEQVQLVGMCLSFIDDSLNRLEKLEKAIKIIKEKQINIVMFFMFHKSFSDYNDWLDRTNHQNKFKPNKKEFDLLNEVFLK